MSTELLQATIDPTAVSQSDISSTIRWQRWLPIAAVLAAACCWATQGVAYALILDGIKTDGLTVVTLRAATATVVLWLWLAVTDPGALRIPRAALPAFTLLGAIAVTIFYPALFYAYQWTSVSVATTLLYLSPTLVTLGAALFLREPLTKYKLLALATTFLGSALVVQAYQPENLTGSAAGIGLGLIAAATYGTYSVLGKKLLAHHQMATVLDGRNAHIGGGVREALGRAPTDFRDYARSAAAAGAWDLANLGAST